jgi:hypothetical protein
VEWANDSVLEPTLFTFCLSIELRLTNNDPAKEAVAVGYSIPGTMADASPKTGRPKADFEVVEISREQYERIKATIL